MCCLFNYFYFKHILFVFFCILDIDPFCFECIYLALKFEI